MERTHPAPHSFCTCGIYASNNIRDLAFRSGGGWTWGYEVIGEVALWGRVFEHSRGWRAEYARPTKFYKLWDKREDRKMRKLAAVYGAEIVDPPQELLDAFEDIGLPTLTRGRHRSHWAWGTTVTRSLMGAAIGGNLALSVVYPHRWWGWGVAGLLSLEWIVLEHLNR